MPKKNPKIDTPPLGPEAILELHNRNAGPMENKARNREERKLKQSLRNYEPEDDL